MKDELSEVDMNIYTVPDLPVKYMLAEIEKQRMHRDSLFRFGAVKIPVHYEFFIKHWDAVIDNGVFMAARYEEHTGVGVDPHTAAADFIEREYPAEADERDWVVYAMRDNAPFMVEELDDGQQLLKVDMKHIVEVRVKSELVRVYSGLANDGHE